MVGVLRLAFLVNGTLTGTNFPVVLAGGGQPSNVFWALSTSATMTTSVFQGNIFAGDAIGEPITLTGGTLTNVAVTMTSAGVIGR